MLSLVVRKNRLERVEIVSTGELLEGFPCLPSAQISFQHLLECLRQFSHGHAGENLPTHGLIRAKTAANKNMITFTALDFRAQQSDVAHEMLGAGIRTTGQMDIEGRIERELFLQIISQGQRMPFG